MLKTLTITQGDSYFVRFPLLKDGQPWPVAGWKFWWTVKRSESDTDAEAVVQKSTDDVTIRTLSTTEVYVVGAPADTKGKDTGRCLWDFQAESPEGDVLTLERGYVVIKPEITLAA